MKIRRFPSYLLAICLLAALCAVPASAAGNTVAPKDGAELYAMFEQGIPSNTTVVLEGKEYQIEYPLYLTGVDNVTIQGVSGTRIICNSGVDTVLAITDSKNIVLENLTLGHNEYLTWDNAWGCTAGVIYFYQSAVTIRNCDLFGCGLYGFDAGMSSIVMENSTIRDCSDSILSLFDGSAQFQNCVFSGNGYADNRSDAAIYLSSYEEDVNVAFSNCTFTNNRNKNFIETYQFDNSTTKINTTQDGCAFSGNGWGGDTPAPVSAQPTNDALVVDGVVRSATVYKIDGSNYFKIRDLAAVLNGTSKQFGVGYDAPSNSVTATTGQGYTKLDTDLVGAASGNAAATVSNDTILVNGKKAENVTVYKINGSNYFKLRDLGDALGFPVDYDPAIGMIINTGSAPAQSAVVCYAECPDVPDFGAYFNIPLAEKAVDIYSEDYGRCSVFYYDAFQVYALGEGAYYTGYADLLQRKGFVFLESFQYKDGYTNYTYDGGNKMIVVGFEDIGDGYGVPLLRFSVWVVDISMAG